jgi:hypothetical protein
MIYIRWCCIDQLSWHDLPGLGRFDLQSGYQSAPRLR